jgi:hypothetical protein
MNADAGILTVNTASWNTSRWYYATSREQAWQVHSVVGINLPINSVVCWSGRSTYWRCREVENGNYSQWEPAQSGYRPYRNLLRLRYSYASQSGCVQRGDSGGPVVQDVNAVAIVAGPQVDPTETIKACRWSIASYARNAAAMMNVTITTN